MTQAQDDAYLCGLDPVENEPIFVAQHMAAYAFMQPQVRGMRVLEVGFGSGYGAAAYLADAAQRVIGVDIAPGNAPRARMKYARPNVTYVQFGGKALPFRDATFDAAGSFQVIEHVPEPDLVAWLTEVRRVLKPRGAGLPSMTVCGGSPRGAGLPLNQVAPGGGSPRGAGLPLNQVAPGGGSPRGVFYVSTLNLEHNQKPGRPYEKLPYHEKEFTAPELIALLDQVFPTVTMYGVHPTFRHRCYRRLKRWGITVTRFYATATTADFCVTRQRVRRAMDLLAVCET